MSQIPSNLSGFVGQGLNPPQVLVIEPDVSCAKRLTETIHTHYKHKLVTHVGSLGEALSLELDGFDMVVSAMDTGDCRGTKVIEEMLLLRPDIPIIVMADQSDKIDAAAVMREGAYDYVIRSEGYLRSIPTIIEKNLALYQVKQENARLQIQLTATLGQLRTKNEQLQGLVKELKQIAATDALTGIANRRAVTQTLDQQYSHATRHDTDLAIIAIDLDGFKSLNDAAGHPAGDRVLMLVARVLSANARASDVPGRIGGDEFIAVLPDTVTAEANRVAKRIQDDFNLSFCDLAGRLGYPDKVTLSVGIATRQQTGSASASELLAAADRALYRAKDAGRSQIAIAGAEA